MRNKCLIALLRSINVGGRTVKMDRLRAVFEDMGFSSVRTHIQSGNVLFDAPDEEQKSLNARIETGLAETLGFAVPAVLLSSAQLAAILAANPFAGRELAEGQRIYITVFRDEPVEDALTKVQPDPKSADEFALTTHAATILCHGGYHETVYSNNFFAKKLKVVATTRNLEVMGKILEMANLI